MDNTVTTFDGGQSVAIETCAVDPCSEEIVRLVSTQGVEDRNLVDGVDDEVQGYDRVAHEVGLQAVGIVSACCELVASESVVGSSVADMMNKRVVVDGIYPQMEEYRTVGSTIGLQILLIGAGYGLALEPVPVVDLCVTDGIVEMGGGCVVNLQMEMDNAVASADGRQGVAIETRGVEHYSIEIVTAIATYGIENIHFVDGVNDKMHRNN